MKKLVLTAVFVTGIVSTSVYALPTYEPFTEFASVVAANPTNAVDLCSNGYTAPSGEVWGSMNFAGHAEASGTEVIGPDVCVTNMGSLSPFTYANLVSGGPKLPANFPGMPTNGDPATAGGAITVVAYNPAMPGTLSGGLVGNSAELIFANEVTRPATGSKTLYISYLISMGANGQLGGGNDGRYLSLVAQSNLYEPSTLYPTWMSFFNFNQTGYKPTYVSHGLLEKTASGASSDGVAYIFPCDSSAPKEVSSSTTVIQLAPSGGGSPPAPPIFVVSVYTFNASGSDTMAMWTNPVTLGGATPASGSQSETVASGYNMANIAALVLEDRVGNSASGGCPSNYIANLMIGSTWSYVTGGPEFTQQPVSVVTNTGGQGVVTFSASATAAGQSVNYQWQKVGVGNLGNTTGGAGGGATVSGAGTATLTLSGVTAGDLGSYDVVATAGGTSYTLTSSTATLTGDPNITAQPQNAKTVAGYTAVFNITATSAIPPVSFQWLLNGTQVFNGQTLGDNSTITVATNGNTCSLTIGNVASDEFGETVTCGVTNGDNSGEFSSAASIIQAEPFVSQSPASQVVNYGATVTLSAQALSADLPLGYAWYFTANSGPNAGVPVMLVNGLQADNTCTVGGASGSAASSPANLTLTLTTVTYQENGSYVLWVTNNANSTASSTAATLFVNDPVINTQPPATLEVPVGGSGTIPISAAGSGVTYSWSGTSINSGDFTGQTTATLSVANAQASDAGTYAVQVIGATNTLTSTATTLYVDNTPSSGSVTPPALTQQAGTHLAIVGTGTGGSGLQYYVWQFDGVTLTNGVQADGTTVSGSGAVTPVNGRSALVLSNLHTGDAGTYTLIVSNLAGTVAAAGSCVVTVASSPLALNATNLVVTRIGEGSQALSGATGNTVYLDQFETNGGVYVNSTMIPDNGGPGTLILPGGIEGTGTNDSMNEGYMTLSSNGGYLNFAGYFQAYPYTGGNDVTFGSALNPRTVGSINALGNYVPYTNFGLYSGGNHQIRDAYSTDGLVNFWTTGTAGSGSIKYVDSSPTESYQDGNGIPAISDALNGPVCLGLAGVNLVFSDNNYTVSNGVLVADTNGLAGASAGGGPPYPASGIDIFNGAPESNPANGGATNMIFFTSLPADFAFSPDLKTLYIADSSPQNSGFTSAGGGIDRLDLVGATYQYQYTLQDTTVAGATNGFRGLTVYFPPNITQWGQGAEGAQLYATTAEVTTNRIVVFTDNGQGSTDTLLATAGPNQFYRGIRFGPAYLPIAVSGLPANVNTYIGQTNTLNANVTGDGPLTYQWQFDGTNIQGATGTSLVLSDVQTTNSGTYTLIVANPISTNTTQVVVDVSVGKPFLVAPVPSYVETAGDHLAFWANVGGTEPLYYQWESNNVPILGATGSAMVLSNITTSYGASYSVIVSNMFGTNTFGPGVLTVTAGLQFLDSNNIVVARVGDGAQALSDTTGNTVYLDQYTTNNAYSNTIMLPDNSATANLIVGGGPSVGPLETVMTLSTNDNFLNICGHNVAYPNGQGTFANPIERTIGAVNAFGQFVAAELNVTIYDGAAPYVIDSAVSDDGLNEFWTTGTASSGGIKYATDATEGSAGGIPAIGGSGSGTRVVNIVHGNVVFTDVGTSPIGIYGYSGEPTAGTTATSLIPDTANLPGDFAASPDIATFPPTSGTVYLADSSPAASGGGIRRYDWNGSSFVLSYVLETGATNGAACLTVNWNANSTWGPSANGAVIFATTAGSSSNALIKIVDTGASSSATVLEQAPASQILRGVRFAPTYTLPGVTLPAGQSAVTGQELDLLPTVTGTQPLSYQWYYNGAQIGGATASTYIIPDLQSGNAGTYMLVATNVVGDTASNATALTVSTFNPTSAALPMVGWWQFNDGPGNTAVDSSQIGQNDYQPTIGDDGQLSGFGDPNNSEWVSPGLSSENYALYFDNYDQNADNVVTVPDGGNAPWLNFTNYETYTGGSFPEPFTNDVAFSVMAWVYATNGAITNAEAVDQALVTKGYGNGGEQYDLDIYSGDCRIIVRSSSGATSAITASVGPAITNWQHVAATCDGYSGNLVLYLNGQVIGSNTSAPNSLLYTILPVTIGNRTASNTNSVDLPFLGEMQDVRIYNAALGQADIQAIYNVLAPPAPEIQVYSNSITLIPNSGAVTFATSLLNETGSSITFEIVNNGNATLTWGPVTVPAGFTVTSSSSGSVAANSSGTFTVQLNTTAAGTNSGNIVIPNNSSVSSYSIAATGIVAPIGSVTWAAVPITGVTGAPNAPLLHFSGTAGGTYHVWSSTSLALEPVKTTWTLLGTGTFSGGNDTFQAPASSTTTFYAITQP